MLIAATEPLTTALLLTTFGVLLLLAAVSTRTFERLGIPVVLVFIVLGMCAGSEGPGKVPFENYTFAFRLGTVALILILLDGGLNTSIYSLKRSIAPSGLLATVGVLITALLVTLFARLLGIEWGPAALIGAVVSSTDAAAVFAILRGGNIRLKEPVGTTLELESGINDPMAVVLTVAITEFLTEPETSRIPLVVELPLQLAIGVVIGLLLGRGARAMLAKIRLSTGGLYPAFTLGTAFFAYGLATIAHGSGFLAVYVVAVILGNGPLPYRSGLLRIHDAIAWLSQIAMFLMLGLLVFPSQLLPVAWTGLGVALFLAFIARPIAAAICLYPLKFPTDQIGYIGWVGLRGAVPIILATFPVIEGVPGAKLIFNIVFFVVVVNSIIPGATIRWLTRKLQLEALTPPPPLAAVEMVSTRLLNGEIMSFHVSESLAVAGASLSHVPFPPESAAILIVRDSELIAAKGQTVLMAGDHVYVFCRPSDRPFIELLFGKPEQSI